MFLCLSLGIGGAGALFVALDRTVLRPLPSPGFDHVVQLGQSLDPRSPARGPFTAGVDPLAFEAIERTPGLYAEMTWMELANLEVRSRDLASARSGAVVAPNFFQFCGVQPQLGRLLNHSDAVPFSRNAPARPTAVIIADGFWRTEFAGDPSVLGRTLELNGVPATIVGVMPPHFRFPASTVTFWVAGEPTRPVPGAMRAPLQRVLLRLPADRSVAQAQAALDVVASRLLQDTPTQRGYGALWKSQGGLAFWCRPLAEVVEQSAGFQDRRRMLFGIGIAVALVLIIVCANVTNLTLARLEGRRQEFAVRAALGADRASLLQLILAEIILLGLAAGAGGALVMAWTLRLLSSVNTLPQLKPLVIDPSALGCVAGLSVFATILIGILPALYFSAARSRLQSSRGASATREARRQQSALIVVQVALGVALLIVAASALTSVWRQMQLDPGLQSDGLVAVQLDPNAGAGRRPSVEARNIAVDRLLEQLSRTPNVAAAGIIKDGFDPEPIVVDGRPSPGTASRAHVGLGASDFLAVTRVPLVAGRLLGSEDENTSGNVVVNRRFATLHGPGERAVGWSFGIPGKEGMRTYTVIGVVGDYRLYSLTEPPRPVFFRPLKEAPATGVSPLVVLRPAPDKAIHAADVIRTLVAGNMHRSLFLGSLSAVLQDSTKGSRTYALWLSAFALSGVLLFALGIFGLVAYSVSRRLKEFGVRIALGASPAAIVTLVLKEVAGLVALGCACGAALSVAGLRLLSSQLDPGAAPTPLVYVTVLVVVGLTTLLACAPSIARALRVNPTEALRQE